MKLIDQLQVRRTGMTRTDDFREPPYIVEYGKTGQILPYTIDANEEWYLTAKIGITFWANNAQFNDAVKIAERALVARLYVDVLAELPELRLSLSNGDKNAAFSICDRIESMLRRPLK